MPPSVNRSNAKHYGKSAGAHRLPRVRRARSHWTCAAPGWEAVADHALAWALQHARTGPREPTQGA